jgi:CRISPR-associated protein Csx16
MVTSPEHVQRRRLISFLGTGRYDRVRHRFPDGRVGAETPYICRALADHIAADEIAVVATTEAEQAHRERLAAELRAANLPAPDFCLVPKGESEADLWDQFDTIKRLLRPPAGTEVVLDVTHAFRSQPFFAAAVTAFVRAVDREPAPLKIFYAAFEARAEDTTPVWELTPFIELVDWSQSMMMFLRTGGAAEVAEKTIALGRELAAQRWQKTRQPEPPHLRKLGEALRDFGNDLGTLRTGDLLIGRDGNPSSAARLASALRNASEDAAHHTPALADVLDRVVEMVARLAEPRSDLSGADGRQVIAELARLYVSFERHLEAAATVREGWINLYCGKTALTPGGAAFDKGERDIAEARAHANDPVFRQVQDRRNDLLHAQYRPREETQDAARIQRSIAELTQKLTDSAETCFVNLSNHPSRDWECAQTASALALAERVEDLAFPNVPPEACEQDLPALAEACVAGIPAGTTHALVQGEFTLAFEIVRRLQERGVTCLAATTERQVEDAGAGRKTSNFRFVRFRRYPMLHSRSDCR